MRKVKNMNAKLLKVSAVLAAPAETSARKAHPMPLR